MNAAFPEPTRHKLSRDDYYRMAEVGILAPDARVELINGEIIDMAPISKTHCGVVDYLTKVLVEAIKDRAIARVQGAITLDGFSEPQPDIAVLRPREDFYCTGETHPAGDDVFLVVEVAVSSERYDREVKVPLYAEHGVPAVLLLVPRLKRFHYYADLHDSAYREQRELNDLSEVPVGVLEGCTVNLSWLEDRTV